ncbi:zinc finger, C2H2 type [Oesophagostomum dentatum]|uniref:Zinc finger, C2H2 type n=1 Tax=Oesophagostomum dentatum TaxID=61180 RepID=A0A0B1T6L9_OESDE|nr:zinc finger, C2H2 type [Oesophagostomum dentatum]
MQKRDQAHVCSCGASFFRAAELRAHKDSCRKRGSFLCIVCDEVFTQRIQLDRHWNKKHFVNSQCCDCEWRASAPLRLAEHALEEHVKRICGYCGVENPEEDHVATEHWKRLSKSVALKKHDRRRPVTKTAAAGQEDTLSCEEEMSSDEESTVDDLSKENRCERRKVLADRTCDDSSTPSTSGSDSETTIAATEIQETDCAYPQPLLPETSDQTRVSKVPQEECYLNVVVSVPDDVVDEFHFGNRLPPEILRLFPEFANARLCLVEPFVGESRFLSLHIPVARPQEDDAEVARLLSVPIYLMEEVQVRHLKRKIAEELLLPCGSFKVLNAGKPLHDDDLQLPAAGLKNGAKLTVVLNTGESELSPEEQKNLKTILGEHATHLNMLRLRQVGVFEKIMYSFGLKSVIQP